MRKRSNPHDWSGLLRAAGTLCGGVESLAVRVDRGGGVVVDLDVERWNVDVSLHGDMGAVQFDGLFHAGDGINGTAQNVGLRVADDVADGLLDFDDLGFALKTVEEKHA